MNEHDLNARKIISDLLKGQSVNGVKPADCGEHESVVSALVDFYNDGGVTAIQVGIDRLRETAPEFYAIICSDPEPKPVFEFLNLDQLFQKPDRVCIISGIMSRGDLIMVYSTPGDGKTFVVIDLAVAGTLAEKWANLHSIPEPLNVAYCTDEGTSSIKARFAAAINSRMASGDVLSQINEHLSIILNMPQLFETEMPESIYKFVEEWKEAKRGTLDILIIDTLHNASVGADENSAQEMGRVIDGAKYVRRELGCAVILVHHTNKQRSFRGSSALHGSMDLMIEIKSDADDNSDVRYASFFKIKDRTKDSPREKGTYLFQLVSDPVSGSAYPRWFSIEEAQGFESTHSKGSKKITKTEQAERAILNLLEKGELSQAVIIEKLATIRIGRHTVRQTLKRLKEEESVQAKDGPNNSLIYSKV